MATPGPLSGFRDFLAEDEIALQSMLSVIRSVYEKYGFTPLNTPALERYETFQGKLGDEGEKLLYKFEDNGGRELAMRYDLTIPLCRVVAQHQSELPMPYKRYAVGPVWRGDRPQAGRFREFIQFDADIVGTKNASSDAEIVAMMADTMQSLGVKATIKVSNRLLLDALAEKAGISDSKQAMQMVMVIDKVEKIGMEAVCKEIEDKFNENTTKLVKQYLSVAGEPQGRLTEISKLLAGTASINEGTKNLQTVFGLLETVDFDQQQIVLDQSIARGLDYYTGIVFETFIEGAEKLGSVCSGGRYDNLIKQLGGPDLPAVGTSVGVDRLLECLRLLGLSKPVKTKTRALIVNFDDKYAVEYFKLASQLRAKDIAVEIYYEAAKLDKQLSYANKLGIPFVLLMGPDEISQNKVTIKNMQSGDQIETSIDSTTQKLS